VGPLARLANLPWGPDQAPTHTCHPSFVGTLIYDPNKLVWSFGQIGLHLVQLDGHMDLCDIHFSALHLLMQTDIFNQCLRRLLSVFPCMTWKGCL
jgi:hypothetical protein